MVGLVLSRWLLGQGAPSIFQVPGASAAESRGTYVLSDSRTEYPYARPAGTDESTSAFAGVSFVATWSDGVFPGETTCTTILRDAAANEVGRLTFLATSLSSGDRTPIIAVRVNGAPTQAEATCEPGAYDVDADYDFELVGIKDHALGNPNMSSATYRVSWATGNDPGARMCVFRATLKSGGDYSSSFTLTAPDATVFAEGIPAPPSEVVDVSIRCEPI